MSALAGAAHNSVIIKGGAHLERLASTRVVAFDKPGTVTTGQLHVGATHAARGHSEAELLAMAASVESRSDHPIAAAVLRAADERGIPIRRPDDVRALPGLGVEGMVAQATVVC